MNSIITEEKAIENEKLLNNAIDYLSELISSTTEFLHVLLHSIGYKLIDIYSDFSDEEWKEYFEEYPEDWGNV